MHHSYGNASCRLASWLPRWHLGKQTYSFHIQRLVTSFDDADMGNIAIGVDHKTASDTPFYALGVCICRIMPVFVDVVEEGFVASRERGFHFHIVIFEHFFICLKAIAGDSRRYAAGLSPGVGESQD